MYDLIVIGGGWAGINACREAAVLGLKTCLVEEGSLGGTCLNRGCIPTKSLVQSSKILSKCRQASSFGILLPGEPAVDFTQVQKRKNLVVSQLGAGIPSLLSGIEVVNGRAEFRNENTIAVGDKTFQSKRVLYAAGSVPAGLGPLKADGTKVLSSDHVLSLTKIPPKITIIGGGVIGCEFAGIFSSFGSSVCLVEYAPRLLPGIDHEISARLETRMKKRGIEVRTSTDALSFPAQGIVFLCAGRAPAISALETLGATIEKGAVWTNQHLQTSVPGVYAAGDCTGKYMLAHAAAFQGRTAVRNIAGENIPAYPAVVPSCIFSDPEIGAVGMSEEEATGAGLKVIVKKFNFLASGMARVLNEADGFIKIIIEESSEKLLGASIIGPDAVELISVFSLALHAGLTARHLRNTLFAHPTLAEGVAEAVRQ